MPLRMILVLTLRLHASNTHLLQSNHTHLYTQLFVEITEIIELLELVNPKCPSLLSKVVGN